MRASPTKLSLDLLRRNDWVATVVERYNQFSHTRQDVFGFADILAFQSDTAQIALVQTTSVSNYSSRYHKIAESQIAAEWLQAGGLIILHGWKQPGGPRTAYQVREHSFMASELITL